ncbi:sodium channel protein Nach-like [Spodoptera frugiperda]|uniref:Sodium channel protein Nach-like n=1 Tax=Spodoptera frugiperda TaxID=7108 RepID=A0A9R0DR70_SPOFR|nr:sodium channel protein Nach-like [Spodoptera frugiperda]
MGPEFWWIKYRKKNLQPRYRLTTEMLIRKSLRETFKEYISCSSLPGVRQLVSPEEPILARLCMFVMLCLLFSTVQYYLYLTWTSTLSNPLVVSGESFTYPIKDIDFPAVALCNINRISKKALKKMALEMYPKLNKLHNLTVSKLEHFLRHMGQLINFEKRPSNFSESKLIEEYSKVFGSETVNIMNTLAPSCDEMLLRCIWGGKLVNCSSIFTVRRTVLGHCCAFNYVLDYGAADNPKGTIGEVKRQIVPGLMNGLRVIIDTMLDDYAYPLHQFRQGFDILVFNSYHFADMTGGRVLQRTVQPSQAEYYLLSSIKQVASSEVRKYPIKTRQCLFQKDLPKMYKNIYSYSSCITKCRIETVQTLCKCTPYFLPSTSRLPICTLKELNCLHKYKDKLQYLYPRDAEGNEALKEELTVSMYCPNCWPDCELTDHSIRSYKIDSFRTGRPGFRNSFLSGLDLRNKSVISVFQATGEGVLHRLDVVSYWYEILSNIGSFAGVCMGIGIFTFVEIIYFMFIRFFQIMYSNYVTYNK